MGEERTDSNTLLEVHEVFIRTWLCYEKEIKTVLAKVDSKEKQLKNQIKQALSLFLKWESEVVPGGRKSSK